MRTDVKIGLVCAFVIVMGAVIYFVAQPAHPAKNRTTDAQAAASGTTTEPSTAPATAPSLASGGSVGGPFILPPGSSEPTGPMASTGTPAGPTAEPSPLSSGIPPFGAPSMNGQFAPGTLSGPTPAAGGLTGSSASASGTPGASTGTFGTSTFGSTNSSAASGSHAGTIDLSGSSPFGSTSLGSSSSLGSSTATTYVIQKDDTLAPIAKRFGVSVSAILAANPGLNANRMQINKTINIPASSSSAVASGTTPSTGPASHGSTHDTAAHATSHTTEATASTATPGSAKPGNSYKIKKSDTLMTIARTAYGSEKDWKRIYKANEKEISNPNLVPVGLVIKIPQ